MSCATVQKSISAFLDRMLAEEERIHVSLHLKSCRKCAAYYEQMARTHGMVAELPHVSVPARIRVGLRVIASHERERRLRHGSASGVFAHWRQSLWLFSDNLMRPLALPFAGGLVSALFLMSMLVGTLGFRINFHNDVPTAFYTQPSLEEMAPFGFDHDEVVVELTVNERGQITDCSFPDPKISRTDLAIANMMLFSRFQPATLFGQPTSGKIRVSLRKNSIVVRG